MRCWGACSYTAYDGYFTHRLPGKMPAEGERFTALQKAWIEFINRRRKLDTKDAKLYKSIVLCSGHFREEDYEPLSSLVSSKLPLGLASP